MSKKVEIPLRQYMESEIYQVLKNSINDELNNNTQMMNLKSNQIFKFKSNLIPKYDFKKTDYEKQQCKKLKKLYKEYINTETSHKLKSEMIQIIAHSTPNWNVSLTILS